MRATAGRPSWIRHPVMRTEAAAANRPGLRKFGTAMKYSPILTSAASLVDYHLMPGIKTFSDLGLFLVVGGVIPALISIILSQCLKIAKAERTGALARQMTLETQAPLINAQQTIDKLRENLDMIDLQFAEKRVELARKNGDNATQKFLVREIGKGGAAFVWKVYDDSTKRMIVWKVPRPETLKDPRLLRRFEREADVMSSLKHENIISFHRYYDEEGKRLDMEIYRYISEGHTLEDFKETGVPFMEMEYLGHECPPLDSIINLRGRLPVEEALSIATQAANALGAIHRYGLVHRDIKPGNIYVGKDGKIKIGDFGLVKIEQEGLTKLTRVDIEMMGTPELMAPEQWEPKIGEISGATDQYSLAVTLYLMIAGVFPYGNCGNNNIEVFAYRTKVISPDVLPEKSPHIPDNLWNILLRMLAENPKDRFPSMEQCIAAFQSAYPRRLVAKLVPGTNV